jgi:hypothetical protein
MTTTSVFGRAERWPHKRTRAEEQGKPSAGNSGSRVSRGGAGGNGHLETPG